VLLVRMRDGVPSAVAAFAHTLKGSARGIGAFEVATAAGAVETHARSADGRATAFALTRLAAAVATVKAAIADRRHHHGRGEE
jgi:HPt (histidine-containing phosphotransfer) domain-containing protein